MNDLLLENIIMQMIPSNDVLIDYYAFVFSEIQTLLSAIILFVDLAIIYVSQVFIYEV
jgi:hypothetical protein